MTTKNIKSVKEESDKLIYGGDLSKYGKEFQIKFLSLLMKDRPFSMGILPIVKAEYFSDIYLRKVFVILHEYITQYPNSTASVDNLKILLIQKNEKVPIYEKILEGINEVELTDRDFVITNAHKFCFSKHALLETEKQRILLEEGKFEEAQKISFEAFKHANGKKRKEFDLKKDHERLFDEEIAHRPVPLPLETINKVTQGGPGAGHLVISVAASNYGKCFKKGTKIRMFDLSLKNIEHIVIGDKLLGPDGSSRTITSLANGEEEMFEIQQSNGITYTVNKSHILCLKRKKHRTINYISLKEKQKHINLENDKEYVNVEVGEYITRSNNWKDGLAGYKAPQGFEEKELLIAPYYFGLWLGDGSHDHSYIHNVDKEVIDYVYDYIETDFPNMKVYCAEQTITGKDLTHKIVCKEQKKGRPYSNSLNQLLRHYNVWGNKHIPDEYLFSSKKQRLQLLAGLLDSDGYLEKNAKTTFEFVQKRKKIAWQVYILASSLGFKCKFYENEYSTVSISGNTHLIPTKIPRKQAVKRKKKNDTTLSKLSIVSKGIGEYYGFTLSENDPDKKFLLEDFTVVHNTAILTAFARHANSIGKNVLFFSFEIGGFDIIRRYLAGAIGVKQEDLKFHKKEVKNKINVYEYGNLKIIENPATSATIEQMKADIEYYKSTGFFADMICVDSLNQLKVLGRRIDDDNTKFEYLAEALRDLAGEEALPIHTVFQTNRCNSLETKVLCEKKGLIEMRELKLCDKIYTHKGYKTINDIYYGKEILYKIKLKNGKEFKVSAKHLSPTGDNKLLSIETGLKPGMKLLCKK